MKPAASHFTAPRHVSSIITAVIVAAVVWALADRGLLRPLDSAIYDRILKLRERLAPLEANVCIIEVEDPAGLRDEDGLLRLLRCLESKGCRGVLLYGDLPESPTAFIDEASRMAKVVVASRLDRVVDANGTVTLRPRVLGTPYEALPWGLAAPPTPEDGVARSHPFRIALDDWAPSSQRIVSYVSAEAEAARVLEGRELPKEVDRFLVLYRSLDGLPTEALANLRAVDLEASLSTQLIRDAYVVVGPRASPDDPRVATPATAGGGMSMLEYRAHALNTLLCGARIRELGRTDTAALLLLMALVNQFLYGRLGVGGACWLTATCLALYGGGSAASLIWGDTWVPPGGPAAIQGTLLILTLRRGAVRLTTAMEQFVSDASSQLRDKYWPVESQGAVSPWALVGRMVNQTLDLNRTIFLEAVRGDTKVREIASVACSLDDVAERRRDYDRAPYSDALSRAAPIKVKGFLGKQGANEEQYLAPLVFCDEILGFWVLGIEDRKAAAIPQFDQVLKDFTRKIGELLYYTRKTAEKDARARGIRHRMGLERNDLLHQDLSAAMALLNHRLDTLEVLMNRLESGIIVYDVFGRVLQINKTMLSLLGKEGLKPFDMTLLDLVLAVSEYDLTRAKKLLRRVIVEDAEVAFPALFKASLSERFWIRLKPLVDQPSGPEKGLERAGGKSVLCELVDTTSVSVLHEMKHRLTERLGMQLRGDLAAIDLCSDLLRTRQMPHEERAEMARIIDARVRRGVTLLTECQQYVGLQCDQDELERFPVDPEAALFLAREAVGELMAARKIDAEVVKPAFMSFVFASGSRLHLVFAKVLRVLCEDAVENTRISIDVEETEDVVSFLFKDEGIGMPDDLFQDYLGGVQIASSETFQDLQDAVKSVKAWGGTLQGRSGLGEGMEIQIELLKFI